VGRRATRCASTAARKAFVTHEGVSPLVSDPPGGPQAKGWEQPDTVPPWAAPGADRLCIDVICVDEHDEHLFPDRLSISDERIDGGIGFLMVL
jgi:hypothetical protein